MNDDNCINTYLVNSAQVIHYRHDQEDSDDAKNGAKIRSDIAEHRRQTGRESRATRGPRRLSRSPQQAHALRSPRRPPLTKQMSRQSLHSRRRLANMLVALVVVFATCWLPYVSLRSASGPLWGYEGYGIELFTLQLPQGIMISSPKTY